MNKDPFNLSNDEYYNPRLATDAALKANLGITLLQVNAENKHKRILAYYHYCLITKSIFVYP